MKRIEVAVGVLRKDEQGQRQVLVGQRLFKDRYFEKWEFPGGKLEVGELPVDALTRELKEELDIQVQDSRPLIQLEHDYPDRQVRLFVFEVLSFNGEPKGKEGQAIKWVEARKCHELDFLEANTPIIHAAQLPRQVLITDFDRFTLKETLSAVEKILKQGESLMIQVREPKASLQELSEYKEAFKSISKDVIVMANSDVDSAYRLGFDGVHLNSERAIQFKDRNELPDFWVGVSCHNKKELQHAEVMADFAFLSPIQNTRSHPDALGLGWEYFSETVRKAKIPTYALGGMSTLDIEQALQYGGQGIAGISGYFY
jgi:8-oxo-dGTP diphosphatase